MSATGKTKIIPVAGRKVTFFNQRCRDWTQPYEWEGNGSTLSNAGCGIFGLCVCVEWLTGQVLDPDEVAVFSCENGGRDDDGTNRPNLLHAVMACGRSESYGFTYHEDGLRNDLDALWEAISTGKAVALCNLRVGHIVSLVAARVQNGERQLLAIDSYSESADERVRDHVCEVIPGSEIRYTVKNRQGLPVGENEVYAAYWVSADTPMDFNLLWRNNQI